MSHPFIVVGDKIDHGGVVVSGTATTDINGLPVARINDKVSCSQHGATVIASGDPTVIIDGQPVARHGDKTACGATLISGMQAQVFIDTGGGGGAGGGSGSGGSASTRGAAAAVASVVTALQESSAQSRVHDEQIQFVNANGANGANLADVSYTLHLEDGVVVSGQTDAEGRAERVSTTAPVRIVRAELKANAASCCATHAQQSGTAPTLSMDIADVTTNPVDVGSSAAVVTTPAGEARGLTSGEIAISRQVFADSIDYAKVKIHNGEYLWFGMQPDDTAMTPNGEMYFNEKHFLEDFSAARGTERHWFMHEMVHVWQHQLDYPVKARGAIRIGLSYEYTLASDKRLSDYNMEAQGNILADYYVLKFERNANLMAEIKYAAGSDALSLFETVLSDFLRDSRSTANLP